MIRARLTTSQDSTNAPSPQGVRAGFTVVELLIALVIGLTLLSMAGQALSPVREASALRSSDYAIQYLVSRARATAIERRETVRHRIDPVGDTAWIQAGTDQVTRFDFDAELGADVVAGHTVTVCMTARGTGDPTCSQPTPAVIGLKVAEATRYVTILPSGQVITP